MSGVPGQRRVRRIGTYFSENKTDVSRKSRSDKEALTFYAHDGAVFPLVRVGLFPRPRSFEYEGGKIFERLITNGAARAVALVHDFDDYP